MTPEEFHAAQAKAMTEPQLLAAVRRLAEALSWRTYHTHRSQHSPAGFPDLCMVRWGRIVFAELKTEKGKTTAAQDAWLADLDEVRARVIAAAIPHTIGPGSDYVDVHLWRPMDLLDGTIADILR